MLSGAYAVLRGAPGIVTAVDRHVVADSSRPAEFLTPEVAAFLELLGQDGTHPAFDASALREGGQKLGLGSSASILVASALVRLGPDAPQVAERERLFRLLLQAHRTAQGGGSGIDVAAAFFGGTSVVRLDASELTVTPVTLPAELEYEVWALGVPATTSQLVAGVFAAEGDPAFGPAFSAQAEAARRAESALKAASADDFIAALRAQLEALRALGEVARLPIVVPEALALHELLPSDSCFLPAGAGGGDVSIHWGRGPSPESFRRLAFEHGLRRVPLSFGAAGASFF